MKYEHKYLIVSVNEEKEMRRTLLTNKIYEIGCEFYVNDICWRVEEVIR